MRIGSNARPAVNMANDDANGMNPVADIPAATDIMLLSAIPQSKKRSGKAFLNFIVFVASAKSASNTTIFGYFAPNSTSASPYASRVAILSPILYVISVLFL